MSNQLTNLALLLAAIDAMPEDVRLALESPKQLLEHADHSTLFFQVSQQLAKQAESGEIEKLRAHEVVLRGG